MPAISRPTGVPPAPFPSRTSDVNDGRAGPVHSDGPGDPGLAGRAEELIPRAHLTQCEHTLRSWLRA